MQERLGLSRKELKERRALIDEHGEECPYEARDEVGPGEVSRDCPFIRHWATKLSYCMLTMGWCRVLHPDIPTGDASMWFGRGP